MSPAGAVSRDGGAPYLRPGLLAAFAALVALRLPAIWPDGRLWAEEGWIYLASAWADPWYAALTKVHTGYLNLPASAATTLAVHLVALESVPLVTVAVALLLQLCPAVLLAASGIRWLRDWRVLAAALALLAVPPLAGEVWLNTITSQFHVMLAVAIILASPPGRAALRWLHAAVLLAAPLCGPGSAMLLPLYLLRAWLDRSAARLRQAALLLPGALVQVALVATHPEPARRAGLHLAAVLGGMAGKQVLLPLLGPHLTVRIMRAAAASFAAGGAALLLVLLPLAAFGALAGAVWRSGDPAARWLLAACLLLMAGSYLGALTPLGPLDLLAVDFGNRYAFAPTVLTGLALLGVATTGPRPLRIGATAVLAWLLLVGVAGYAAGVRRADGGPSWRAEVARWRADPGHALALWPQGWTVALARQAAAP